MGKSVHGDDDGLETGRPGTAMVARNPDARKRPRLEKRP
jgi:hypothetical protein